MQTFEPVTGQQVLVVTEGTVKATNLNAMKATASICTTEEVDARKIGCGVTFGDLKEWGLDSALCQEPTCVESGAKIFGGPVYYPNSSVCLAAEQLGAFKDIQGYKLVRVSESNLNKSEFQTFNSNNIDSNGGKFDDDRKGWTV